MIKLKYKPDPKWKDFYKGNWQTAILIGGRGSGKTWNAGNFTALETFKNPTYRTLVLRDVSSSISQSILQNIKGRISTILTKLEGSFDHVFEIQENQIKNKIHDLVNILTKGFRQSRVEQQADLKGFEDIDLALIEEAEDLRDVDRVNTLIDTLRKEGHKIIIILNTPDLRTLDS
jgi:PBSX family phage terminase large subunit